MKQVQLIIDAEGSVPPTQLMQYQEAVADHSNTNSKKL